MNYQIPTILLDIFGDDIKNFSIMTIHEGILFIFLRKARFHTALVPVAMRSRDFELFQR